MMTSMQMPISELDADGAIQAFYDEFPGLSGLRIIHAASQESFYGHNASVTALGFRIKGAFLPKTRELHLPLANFRDLGYLRQSLQHEALGHYWYCLAAERVTPVAEPGDSTLNFPHVWDEIVVKRMRRMERKDLQFIADFVADGLREGVRAQKIFPANDHAQFDA